jgi:hypothetical protein
MDERRTSARNRSYLGASVAFNQLSRIDCIVRNLGPRGARIACAQNALLPKRFRLEIPTLAWTRRARLVWTDVESSGVEFLDEGSGAASG